MENYFGKNLKYLRTKTAKTQDDIALQVGKGRTTIANWENVLAYPSIQETIKIANYFDVTLDELLITDLSEGNLNAISEVAEKTAKGKVKGKGNGHLNEGEPPYSSTKKATEKVAGSLSRLAELQAQQQSINNAINAELTGILSGLIAS